MSAELQADQSHLENCTESATIPSRGLLHGRSTGYLPMNVQTICYATGVAEVDNVL